LSLERSFSKRLKKYVFGITFFCPHTVVEWFTLCLEPSGLCKSHVYGRATWGDLFPRCDCIAKVRNERREPKN
jgi:hypothetical protein